LNSPTVKAVSFAKLIKLTRLSPLARNEFVLITGISSLQRSFSTTFRQESDLSLTRGSCLGTSWGQPF
jgi:hypothetical protein